MAKTLLKTSIITSFTALWSAEVPQGQDDAARGVLFAPSSNAFQHRLQVLPETLDGRDLDALVGAVGIDDGWAERHHLHAGILLADHAALQAGVHGNQLRGLAE